MLVDKLEPIIARYDEITALLQTQEILNDITKLKTLSKEQSDMESLVQKAREYLAILEQIEQNKQLLEDKELGELAKDELKELETRSKEIQEEIKILLIPKDPNDDKNIYLELRAGTGGDEAGIFVGDLFKAYCRYADLQKWKVEIISSSENNVGGYKEVIALIKGKGAYSKLKFEGGTHRVQRVPETESQGRIHTSAITVAIMPEVDDVQVHINPSDLNVSMQDEKSQHKNKDKAMKILQARIYEAQLQEQLDQNAAARKNQVGSGDRSERIRTYNYPQNRLSDHRINLTLYSLEEIMLSGNLDLVINPLIAAAQSEAISNQS